MNEIQNKYHRIEAYKINIIYFSCFDDKMYILNNGIDGLALDHNQKLLKAAFLSNFKSYVLILSLVGTTIFYFFVLIYIKWLIMNIVQTTKTL